MAQNVAGVMELLHFAKSRRGGELIGIVILAAGLSLGAAVVSYHPEDSSAFYTSTNNAISNVIGYYGATVAWIFVGFFGFASLLFPFGMLIIGWQRFWGKELEFMQTKLIGWVTLLIAVPPLLDLSFGKVWFRGALITAGGYLGQEIDRAATLNLNRGGSWILFGTMLLVGLLLSTRISLASIFMAIKENLIGFGRTLTVQWARLTDRRRKEKMKEAIVRKHALRLVEQDESLAPEEAGPLVREVKGAGRFQIRKVTKADLRKAAEALSQQEKQDPFELYAHEPDLEEPLFLEPKPKPRVLITRPAVKPMRPAKRELRNGNEELPAVSLLAAGAKQDHINDDVHKKYLEIGRLIEERCREFAVEGEVTAYHPGPVVTTFEFKPSAGVKYARVVNLGDDLALALKAESIRIERISGSSTVGIEVPNRKRDLITLRDIIDTETFSQSPSLLTLALGKDIHGDPIVTDLGRMPHLLVAGATGAGKSVGLNSMIVSLLYKALPRQLRMLMIDPKMVELKIYEDIPHLLHPIVTDPKLASNALIWAVAEMENRYRTLAECGVRNIDQYNALLKDPEAHRRARKAAPDDDKPTPDPMHYIVIIIDEFADLMMIAPKDVEDSVTRLAQKARAVGIHLIVATQRPSVDVITGVIKANFPSRIAYQVASRVDSRTILDTQGAEKLLGSGDMLFLPPGTARIRRIHGAYLSEGETNEVVDFVKRNQGEPKFLEEITKVLEEKSAADGIEYLDDPKYEEAVRVVLSTGQASASYLQRRLKLGYSRAARLIEIMEAHGVVGPSQGSKPRDILIRAEDYPPASGQI
jgi:S-DNA-T family DNA segregation ATPase FtsK/SpoIIIE